MKIVQKDVNAAFGVHGNADHHYDERITPEGMIIFSPDRFNGSETRNNPVKTENRNKKKE